jgi:hypothetical protein
MTFNSFHSDYELTVRKMGSSYMVILTSYAPVHQEAVLHAYPVEQEAVQAAKQFPARYQLAKVRGYVLEDQYFQHANGKSIHISFAMDLSISNEKFRSFLDS